MNRLIVRPSRQNGPACWPSSPATPPGRLTTARGYIKGVRGIRPRRPGLYTRAAQGTSRTSTSTI